MRTSQEQREHHHRVSGKRKNITRNNLKFISNRNSKSIMKQSKWVGRWFGIFNLIKIDIWYPFDRHTGSIEG